MLPRPLDRERFQTHGRQPFGFRGLVLTFGRGSVDGLAFKNG